MPPNVTDNVGVRMLTKPVYLNNTWLRPGIYNMIYTASDWDGNIANCSFKITVKDGGMYLFLNEHGLEYSSIGLACAHVDFQKKMYCLSIKCKRSLKIPKGNSESVNRRTDNTMAKRKSTKGQITIYKTCT